MSRSLVTGALAAVAVIAGAILLLGGGADHSYKVRAEFRDIEGVRKNYWVKINGARVGSVENVSVTPRGTAMATLKLDRHAVPLGDGARAEVRPANLLGEKYIQLHAGDRSRPMASGALIPMSRTGTSVELDQVLDMLAPDIRARVRILINEAGVALAGRGTDFNTVLRELPGSVQGVREILVELRGENQKLGQLVDQADRAVGPLDERRREAAQFIADTTDLLSTVADRRAALAATVRSAPAALGQVSSTLDQLDVAAQRLEPSADLLRQAAAPLTSTLRELPAFAGALRSPLATATHVAPRLRTLGTRGTGSVRRLRPTVQALSTFVDRLRPLTYALGRGGGVDGVVGILNNWSNTASYEDGISHYFDFHVSFSKRALTDAVQRLMGSLPAPSGSATAPRPAGALGLPALTPQIPGRALPKVKVPALKLPHVPVPQLRGPSRGGKPDSIATLLDYLLK